MAHGGDRFRRLRTARNGDLFEHFGVGPRTHADPEVAEGTPTLVVISAAAACDHCGWYRALPVRNACPLCGGPGREQDR
jgi:hypothetical protein